MFGIFPVNAVSASRGIVFETTSPALPVTGGSFPTKDLSVQFREGGDSAVDYLVTGQLDLNGRRVMAGVLTNRVSATGSLSTLDGVETLTIPVDADYTLFLEGDVGVATFNLRFTGQLVATRAAAPEPVVVLSPPAEAGGPLILTFPNDLYKLQRTTTLFPPDWIDVESPSPVTLPPSGPEAYFRVVPR